MAFTNITKPAIGEPTKQQTFAALVVDNLAFLYNFVLSLAGTRETITNGSFESDADADSQADGWTLALYTGGSYLHDISTAAADGKAIHGKRSVKLTSPGGASNGGGTLTSTDFFEITEGRTYYMTWQHKSSAAGIHNLVQIQFFDSTQTSISTTTLYDSAANPTSWTLSFAGLTPPANSRYAKVILTGAKNDNTTAGSAWFDDVRITALPSATTVVHDANTTWVVPAGVFKVRVRCWGGGGAGQNGAGNSGGAGGYGEDIFTVIPGTSYTVTIGAGGVASGGNGGTSSLVAGAVTLISSTGGGGAAGAAGTGGTSSATVNMPGQKGGTAKVGGFAGGGGGQGGNADAEPGLRPGGGGAGATGTAGAGGAGRIIIEY